MITNYYTNIIETGKQCIAFETLQTIKMIYFHPQIFFIMNNKVNNLYLFKNLLCPALHIYMYKLLQNTN